MRTLTSEMQTEIQASIVRPIYLLSLEFDSATVRLWNGNGDLSWNTQTWLGNGWFNGLSSIRETGGVESNGVEVTLSGVPETLVSLVLNDARQNLTGSLYLGFLDASDDIINSPFLLFEGGLDVPKISDSPNGTTISLVYENHLVFLKRKKELRYTDAMQKQLFPGDKGFEFVTALTDWSGFWGRKTEPPTSGKKSRRR